MPDWFGRDTSWNDLRRIATGINASKIVGAGHDPVSLDDDADNILTVGAGDIPQEIGLQEQDANTVFAGPVAGIAAIPDFRALVTADVATILPYAAPALTLGLANAVGAANTVIRTDATILTFDVALPAAIVAGAAGNTGAATVAARRDHVHPAPGTWPATAHDLLSATHGDTVASVVTRGDLVVGTVGGWDDLDIGGAHQFLKVNAGGTDPAWASFDWDDISAAAAADMAHDHSAAGEGGEVPLASLGSYTQGDLIIGGAVDWIDLAISVPAAGILNYLGVNNGETVPSWKSASSDPGGAASILASAADGGLELLRLGIGADPDTNNRITMVDGGQIGDTGEPLITFDNTLDYLEITGCDVGIGSTVAPLRLWVEEIDASTNIILDVVGISHNSTNVPAALFGTALAFYQNSSTSDDQRSGRIQTLWTDATHASRNALMRFDTYPNGVAVGHFGFWSGDNIDNVAQVVVPGGAGDVTAIAYVGCAVVHSAGGTSAVAVSITPGNQANLYDIAGNTLTCIIAAGGEMTVQRTAGVGSYDAAIWFMWV